MVRTEKQNSERSPEVGRIETFDGPANLDTQHSSSSDDVDIRMLSARIFQVMVPVTLCAAYVVTLVRTLGWSIYKEAGPLDRVWQDLSLAPTKDASFSTTLLNSVIIVIMFGMLLIFVTLIILLILYLGLHSCLTYYFYIPSFMIMAIITPAYLRQTMSSLNTFGLDALTLAAFVWNFTALGMMAIFSFYAPTPLTVQQFYLIHNSSILAVLIIQALPSWAPWMLLVFLVAWDLFAVLAPIGPLKLIINLAERRGIVEMPGLVYSTDIPLESGRDRPSEPDRQQIRPDENPVTQQTARIDTSRTFESDETLIGDEMTQSPSRTIRGLEEPDGGRSIKVDRSESGSARRSIQEKGVNIGLGDFIFYSLLVGLTAKGRTMNDFYATLASLDAILVGLALTLIALALTRRAMPALPISIGLGLITVAVTSCFAAQLANRLAWAQIFI